MMVEGSSTAVYTIDHGGIGIRDAEYRAAAPCCTAEPSQFEGSRLTHAQLVFSVYVCCERGLSVLQYVSISSRGLGLLTWPMVSRSPLISASGREDGKPLIVIIATIADTSHTPVLLQTVVHCCKYTALWEGRPVMRTTERWHKLLVGTADSEGRACRAGGGNPHGTPEAKRFRTLQNYSSIRIRQAGGRVRRVGVYVRVLCREHRATAVCNFLGVFNNLEYFSPLCCAMVFCNR